MYYLVYLTTNKINNKIYVGSHSTLDLNDNYLGSGKLLFKAIKKYGKENFKRTIIHFCLTKDDMFAWEKTIVDNNFLLRKDIYNMTIGGYGGDKYNCTGRTYEELHGIEKAKMLKELRSRSIKGIKRSDETKMKLSKAKTGIRQSEATRLKTRLRMLGNKNHFFGKKHSEETKQLIGSKSKNRNWAKGSRSASWIDISLYNINLVIELYFQKLSFDEIRTKYYNLTNQKLGTKMIIKICKENGLLVNTGLKGKAGRIAINNFIDNHNGNFRHYNPTVEKDAKYIADMIKNRKD